MDIIGLIIIVALIFIVGMCITVTVMHESGGVKSILVGIGFIVGALIFLVLGLTVW